jgi:hypothetical protein
MERALSIAVADRVDPTSTSRLTAIVDPKAKQKLTVRLWIAN